MKNDLSDIFESRINKTSKTKKKAYIKVNAEDVDLKSELGKRFDAVNKKKPPDKKQKITPPPADAEYEKMLAEAMGEGKKGNDDSGVDKELEDLSYIAKLELDISKAKIGKYKAEQERLKLMKQSGEVMEFDKGDMLFFGFIEKGSIESLRVTKKLQARIKNLCDENDPKGIMNIIDRELENIFVNIQEEQLEAVEKWQKQLK